MLLKEPFLCMHALKILFLIRVRQVFHSLLKAHAVEARGVVRQALDILTPAMPARMEDGNVSWNKFNQTKDALGTLILHGVAFI